MIDPAILQAIAKIELAGASIRLDGGRPMLFGAESVPGELVAFLRDRKAEVIAYLASADRPAPTSLLFVSRKLRVVELPAAVVWDGPAIWRNGDPFYRLNPRVYVWACAAVDAALARGGVSESRAAEVRSLIVEMGEWVARHYPPHRIEAAKALRPELPAVIEPPSIPGADAWAVTPQSCSPYGAEQGAYLKRFNRKEKK
jgi:hypothetical protein